MPTNVEPELYQGRVRRRCEHCGVEVEIEKPTRALSATSNLAWKRAFRKEVQRQILWPALCEQCRAFWNRVLEEIIETVTEPELEERVA